MPIKITHQYLLSQGLSSNFPERFWDKVKKLGPKKCWIWTGARFTRKGKKTYGSIFKGVSRGAGVIFAHRASWIIHFGPIPEGMDILHDCAPSRDNQACVNPIHLKLGTDSENQKDAFKKGDQIPRRGELSGCHKLTKKQIIEIRSRYVFRGGPNSGKSLAMEFGVTPACISQIVLNQHWIHV